MEIRGQLRDDILNGNAVLFLGAGIGNQAEKRRTPVRITEDDRYGETRRSTLWVDLGLEIGILIIGTFL